MSATQRPSPTGFEEMVKDFWATRPRRPRSGRVIAGVAAGIGRRYGIDPVIVRVALVVGAIYGGAGLVCYLLGWLLLAEDGDQVSPFEALLGRGKSSMSRGFTVVLCIALFPATNFVFGGHWSQAGGLILLGLSLFLLHRYRGDQGQITPGPAADDLTARREAGHMTDTEFGATPPTDHHPLQDAVPNQPPAWDPLGAAPFAWDLPEPTPVPPPAPPVLPRQRKARTGLATLGVLFVTGAALAAIAPSVGWLTPGHILGILAAITGIGLIVGAVTHSGHGLIPLAVLLSAASFALTASHFNGWHGAGDETFRPTRIADVQSLYQHTAGNVTLDLRDLPANGGTVKTEVSLGVGNLTVLVPRDATVHATCRAQIGNVDCLGKGGDTGAGSETVTASQLGASDNQLTIVVDAHDGPGQTRVVATP